MYNLYIDTVYIEVKFIFFSVDEAEAWVRQLEPSGGCNLLKGLKHILKVKDLDSIVLIIGSV